MGDADSPLQEFEQEIRETKEEMQALISAKLQNDIKSYEEQKQFLEADEAYKEILQLKNKLKELEKQALETRQTTEFEEIDNLREKDKELFSDNWSKKISEYKEKASEMEQELIESQEKAYEAEEERLERETPQIPKHSRDYLELEKVQSRLVRQKEYKQAHVLQQEMDKIQEGQLKKWEQARQKKIQLTLLKLKKTQAQELQRFKKRVKQGLIELKNQRKLEREAQLTHSLTKHYKNIKNELSQTHRLENKTIDGQIKSQSGKAVSNSVISNVLKSASASSFADRLIRGKISVTGKDAPDMLRKIAPRSKKNEKKKKRDVDKAFIQENSKEEEEEPSDQALGENLLERDDDFDKRSQEAARRPDYAPENRSDEGKEVDPVSQFGNI